MLNLYSMSTATRENDIYYFVHIILKIMIPPTALPQA